jgi:hypothetical protein
VIVLIWIYLHLDMYILYVTYLMQLKPQFHMI